MGLKVCGDVRNGRRSVSLIVPVSLPLSFVPLSPPLLTQGAVIGIDDEDDSTFTITVDQKTFHFQGETYLFCLFFIPSLCWCQHPLDTLVCIRRLSLSLSHSPPLRGLDWSTQIPGNACMDTMSRMLHTGASFLWILFKL